MRYLFLLCAIVFSYPVWSATPSENLESFLQGVHGLEGSFSQQVLDEKGRLKDSSSGKLAIALPNLLHWEYTKPHPQQIIADGHKIWIYDPELEQVTTRMQRLGNEESALLALMNPKRMADAFIVTQALGQNKGLGWLQLTPKNPQNATFQLAQLGIGSEGLAEMEVTDNLGQRTLIQFSHWKRNPKFPPGTFTFTPQPGIDVIEQ